MLGRFRRVVGLAGVAGLVLTVVAGALSEAGVMVFSDEKLKVTLMACVVLMLLGQLKPNS